MMPESRTSGARASLIHRSSGQTVLRLRPTAAAWCSHSTHGTPPSPAIFSSSLRLPALLQRASAGGIPGVLGIPAECGGGGSLDQWEGSYGYPRGLWRHTGHDPGELEAERPVSSFCLNRFLSSQHFIYEKKHSLVGEKDDGNMDTPASFKYEKSRCSDLSNLPKIVESVRCEGGTQSSVPWLKVFLWLQVIIVTDLPS